MKQRTIEISKAIYWVLMAILVHLLALVLGAMISAVYATLLAVPFVLLGLWILCRAQKKSMGSVLHTRRFPAARTGLAFIMGFTVYASVSCIVVYTFLNDLSPEATENIEEMFAQTPFLALVCSTAIAAPLIEELTFRGFVYETLQRMIATVAAPKLEQSAQVLEQQFSPEAAVSVRKRGAVLAIILQALLFGAFHMNLQQFIYASVLGLLFGLMRYQTDSVWPGVFAHIGFNFFSVGLYGLLQMQDTWPFARAVAQASDWVLLAVTLPIFLIAFVRFECLCRKCAPNGENDL